MLNFFSGLKAKLYAFVGVLFIALLAVIKWQNSSRKEKDEKISELKTHIKVAKKLSDENMKVKEFNARQELKKQEEDKKIAKHNKEVEDAKEHIDSTIDTITI